MPCLKIIPFHWSGHWFMWTFFYTGISYMCGPPHEWTSLIFGWGHQMIRPTRLHKSDLGLVPHMASCRRACKGLVHGIKKCYPNCFVTGTTKIPTCYWFWTSTLMSFHSFTFGVCNIWMKSRWRLWSLSFNGMKGKNTNEIRLWKLGCA